MDENDNTSRETPTPAAAALSRPGLNYLAWLGPIVTFAGAISYFLYFVRFPDLRDFPWVNLPLVGLGVLLSGVGLLRAFSNANYKILSKGFASIGFLFSLALAALFTFYIFSISYQMPSAEGVSQVSDVAPAFALLDQNNQTVQLSSFRDKKLVITFYRGYW